jgi:dienelactone hydrolase
VLFAFLALLACAAAQDPRADLAQDLARALDGADAKSRRTAALALGARPGLKIDEVLEAIPRAIAVPPEPLDRRPGSGAQICLPLLRADDGSEVQTELHLYVPASLDAARPAPLLLAFHGTGGRGGDVEPMWRATAEKLGMLVLAPSEAGNNEGYAFSDRERRSALAALRWMRRRFDVDENRILATGISRGGHLAWDLALRHPDLFAAIAPMIGGPRFQLADGQNNLRYLENVLPLPIRDLQGMKDDPGLVANLRMAFDALAAKKAADAKLVAFPDLGHSFELGAVDWVEFFGRVRRNPAPDRIVRSAARLDEARTSWVEITKFTEEVKENFTPDVGASLWKSLDEDGKRRFLEKAVEKRTARLEVKRTGPGRFAATGERVASFRLLLTAEMFDPAKPVHVLFNGRLHEKKPKPDPRVLAVEFAERFDRSFLPIAAVDVP